MSGAIITSRSLRNVDTGIDISVPEYKEVSNLLGLSKEEQFNVIVISRLPYFKRECHKSQDIVQFMVTRMFSEFEVFRKAMDEKYSATVFPELPKKSFVLSEDGGSSSKRRAACEKLLQFIASSNKICSSHLLLEFLGVKASKIKEVEEGTTPSKEDSESLFKKVKVKSTSSDLFGEANNSDEELFSDLGTDQPNGSDDLFADDRENSNSNREAVEKHSADHTVRLFGEEDGPDGGIYVPPGATGDNSDDVADVSEDVSDLLKIEDDLDLLLQKTKPKQLPPVLRTKETGISELTDEKDVTHTQSEIDLDNDDIMKYIADNEEAPSDSLF